MPWRSVLAVMGSILLHDGIVIAAPSQDERWTSVAGRPRSVSDQQIFDAVADVVTDAGPDGLTLEAVSSRVGLTPSALTHRFGTKHRLLVGFAENEAVVIDQRFAAALGLGGDPIAAAVDTLLSQIAGMTDRRALANNLGLLQRDLVDPDLQPHAVAHSRSIRRGLSELMALAADRLSEPPDLVADDLYTAWNGAMLTWAIDGDGRLQDWVRLRLERTIRFHLRSDLHSDPDWQPEA